MKKIYFFLIFLFVSCTSPQPPKWYVDTPQDTPYYFYASAEDYTKEGAVKKALSDIASRINVRINSNFVINKGIHNKKTYKEIYQQINTRVKDINFNNYEILKTKHEDEKYYVLLRVDKNRLKTGLKSKIRLELAKIDFKQNENPIKKVIKAYKTLQKLKKIKSDVFILESLGADVSAYLEKIERLEKKALQTIANTHFSVNADKYACETEEVLGKYLSIKPRSKNVIDVRTETKTYRLFNDYIVKGKTTVLLDRPYTLTFLGKSVTSYKEAETFAKKEYKKRLSSLLKKVF